MTDIKQMADREVDMTEAGSISELIERRRKRDADCEPVERPARKLHWSDIAVAFIALAVLFAASMHVSSSGPRPDPTPAVLKLRQDG